MDWLGFRDLGFRPRLFRGLGVQGFRGLGDVGFRVSVSGNFSLMRKPPLSRLPHQGSTLWESLGPRVFRPAASSAISASYKLRL